MDSQLLTLSKIFTERLFRIPDYQRGYAWQEKQLQEFWNDLDQLEVDRNHYTGVLTLESVKQEQYQTWSGDRWIVQSKSYEPYYVVDGQQRLTTAIILIQVILESSDQLSKLNFTDKEDIRKKFIFDSKDNKISRSYIFSYDDKDPSTSFLKARIFLDENYAKFEETVYTQNLENAKQFFQERVKSLDSDGIQLLYRKVTQNLLFNIFTISDDVDVCVAFETMNNRGKPLSHLELLKNRLIYLSLKFDASPADREALRVSINSCWRSIYHGLGRNKQRPLDDDHFLMTHYQIYFEDKNEESDTDLFESFDSRRVRFVKPAGEMLEQKFMVKNVGRNAPDDARISLVDIYNYVSSLTESIDHYYNIFNPQSAPYSDEVKVWLDRLDRLNDSATLIPTLAALAKVKEERSVVLILKALERLSFIRQFGNRFFPGAKLGSTFPGYLSIIGRKLYKGEISAEKMIKILNERSQSYLDHEHWLTEAVESFREVGFYSWKNIRYFLYEYNLDLGSRSKSDRLKIDWAEFSERRSDFITVEHIYPQRGRTEYWQSAFSGYTAKQRSLLKNSLGNLLPLSRPKNASLSNLPFPDKVEGKNGQPVGFRYGCFAENEVAAAKDWNAQEIAKRGKKLLEFLQRRWSIHFGRYTPEQILGLEFVDVQI